jgi:hypothetical protein
MTVPYIGEWGLYIRWPEQRVDAGTADIKISIRQVDAYEELAPGQLGVEYTEDGQVKLKAGMPNISKWDQLPYIRSGKAVDWNVAEESNPAAIKNKPFGMIEQMVDVVSEKEYKFEKPSDTTTDIVHFSTPNFGDLFYDVWFNDAYLGTAKPGEKIEIPNGQFYFLSGAMVIEGGNYPEGNYKVRIAEKQIVAKKLDSQWLNTQNDIYTGAANDPASCGGVINAVGSVGSQVSILRNQIAHSIIPAIGPIPTEADEGKVLIIRNTTPVWENSTSPPIATLNDIALIFEGGVG